MAPQAELAVNRGSLNDFREFCRVDRQLGSITVDGHVQQIKRFLKSVDKPLNEISKVDIRQYLDRFTSKSKYTYANVLKSLRVFFRDYFGQEKLIKGFRFPSIQIELKIMPSKDELNKFFKSFRYQRDKAMFLVFASSGLRRSEVLNLKRTDVDLQSGFITLKNRNRGRTKHSWISFINSETVRELKQYLDTRDDSDPRLFIIAECTQRREWRRVRIKSGIHITPQVLREWFACEMGRLGVQDRYVDAFQGRIPKSVLARHYTDYSPEKLKEIYDKARLKVLS